MKSCRRAILSTALLLAVGITVPGSSSGQPMDLDTPPSSPLWWTLTDEISPAELREAFRDPAAHLQRYREALEVGVVSQELNEEALSYLSFYYNRRLTPELTPLWLAFDAFAGGHLELLGPAHATDALTEFGFGRTAIDTILLYASRQMREIQEIVEQVGSKSMRFTEIQRRAIQARGGDRRAYAAINEASRKGDLDLLLPSAGIPREKLAELRAAWLRHPVTETTGKLLPQLQQQLTQEEWQRLRRFLLEHVVPGMGDQSIDFDMGKGGQS